MKFGNGFVEVVSYTKVELLLGKAVSINHKHKDGAFWFKITGHGIDVNTEDGRPFIKGYDNERLNRTIFLDEIETIVI